MTMTRRGFLKASGATTVGALGGAFSMAPLEARAEAFELHISEATQTTTICPYCACGCGLIVSAQNGKIVNIEGDPDHPINEGSLCSKGQALFQVANNDERLQHVLYRAPRSNKWEVKTWSWAVDRISRLVKRSRDKGLEGQTSNNMDTIAALGGAALDNEECYVYSKFMRALGVRYIEHQARI
jgi:formate dehydrogenase major subunit